jgi:hypothetical protein
MFALIEPLSLPLTPLRTSMHAPLRLTIGFLLAALTGLAAAARAQDYPNRPVRLITDSAPGGSIDVPVRIIAEGLSRVWRQQAVVINQPGAGGIAWAFSEIPSVLVLIALVFQWYRSEQRTAKRADRAADRDGDQELKAYNAYLASLQARGQ